MNTIYYNTMGHGPDMVLLHGWGFHSGVWETFLPLLTQHFRVTTIDLPGFGRTPLAGNILTIDVLVDSILKVAPKNAIYLGWSLGGLLAMNIAIHYPDRINHLITIASTPKFLAANDWPGMSVDVMETFANSLEKNHQSTLEQFVMLQFQGSNTDRSVIRKLKQQIRNTTPPTLRALTDGLMILKNTDLRNELKQIQCPQQYLFGRCDMIVPVAVAEQTKALTHRASIDVIPHTSHAAFLSHPQQCFDRIGEFLI